MYTLVVNDAFVIGIVTIHMYVSVFHEEQRPAQPIAEYTAIGIYIRHLCRTAFRLPSPGGMAQNAPSVLQLEYLQPCSICNYDILEGDEILCSAQLDLRLR